MKNNNVSNTLTHFQISIFLMLLLSASILQAQKSVTVKEGEKKICKDTLVPNSSGYYVLCCDMLSYSGNVINIATKSPVGTNDNYDCYKFLYACNDNNKSNELFQLTDSVFYKLTQLNLQINNKPFTGYLKIAVYFHNRYNVGGAYTGYNINSYQFNNGVFEEYNLLQDVSLINETQFERPAKPVLYLYPEKKQDITVNINLVNHKFTHTYPAYNNGWTVEANPDGTLVNKATGKEHYCLFWETEGKPIINTIDSGFVVKGSETSAFLEEKLAVLGLNSKEINEFIIYWMPQMENNPCNAIYFAGAEYEEISQLQISPEPDKIIRVMMLWQPLESAINLSPQTLIPISERKGFVAVEWGGTLVNKFILVP